MDKKINKLTSYEKALSADFEGKITSAWYKLCENYGLDLGENDEDNLFFMVFQAGACEGALINNKMWMAKLDQSIQQIINDGLDNAINEE